MEENLCNYFGNYLKLYCKNHSISQSDFADSCGIKQGNLSRIMSGAVICSLDSLIKISNFCNFDLYDMFELRLKTELDNFYGFGFYENIKNNSCNSNKNTL